MIVNKIILANIRSNIKIVSEPLHSRIQAMIEDMSLPEKKAIFGGWAEPVHARWLYDDDMLGTMISQEYMKFNRTVAKLRQHPNHKFLFAVYFNMVMAALIPGESEQQVSEELNRRMRVLCY
jgi:hypothetical protein